MIVAAPPAAPDILIDLPDPPTPILYWSDTHFGHARIIAHCARPFRSVDEMDRRLRAAQAEADASGAMIIHAGDIGTDNWEARAPGAPTLPWASRHVALCGNHDVGVGFVEPGRRAGSWAGWYGRLLGDPARDQWHRYGIILTDRLDGARVRVLVTHAPSPNLFGCAWNVHGHLHDNWDRAPEAHAAAYPWMVGETRYLNASVERTGYRPRGLGWLVEGRGEGARASTLRHEDRQ